MATQAWEASAKPFMTGVLKLKTWRRETEIKARVFHWTMADREAHEKWASTRLDQSHEQLAELVAENFEVEANPKRTEEIIEANTSIGRHQKRRVVF